MTTERERERERESKGKRKQEREFVNEYLAPVFDYYKSNRFPLSSTKLDKLYKSWQVECNDLDEIMELENEVLPSVSPELHKLVQSKFKDHKITLRKREFACCEIVKGEIFLRKADKREVLGELAHEAAHIVTRLYCTMDNEVLPELAEFLTLKYMKEHGILPNPVVANHKLQMNNIATSRDIDHLQTTKQHVLGAVVSLNLADMIKANKCTFEELLAKSYDGAAKYDYRARFESYGVTPKSVLKSVERYTEKLIEPLAEQSF
jgi:hypothetical protein